MLSSCFPVKDFHLLLRTEHPELALYVLSLLSLSLLSLLLLLLLLLLLSLFYPLGEPPKWAQVCMVLFSPGTFPEMLESMGTSAWKSKHMLEIRGT